MLDSLGISTTTLISTAVLGPGSLVTTQIATRVYAEMGSQLLQGAGDFLGLSQSQIGTAQSFFSGQVGDSAGDPMSLNDSIDTLGQQFGASPAEIGDQQRQTADFINDTIKRARDSVESNEAEGGSGKNGWLMAMAKVLGQQLDQLGEEMTSMASRITKDTPGLSAEFSVVTQQFSMLMNATTNAIKTVGEAMGKAANKN